MGFIAYIPARGGSKRILRKNAKLLKGVPIISYVIKNLKKLDFLDGICVSTDDKEIAEIASKLETETLELRTEVLANDHATFQDLVRGDLPRYLKHFKINENDAEILFVLATAALVTPEIYQKAYQEFRSHRSDILVSSIGYRISPYWALTEHRQGYWKPVFPDKIAVRSQELPKTQVDAGLFYYLKFGKVKKMKGSWMNHPDGIGCFEVPRSVAIDVDTPEDWVELERLFERTRA